MQAHAARTGAEMALRIKGIEPEISVDQVQNAMLGNALTRLMEAQLWLDRVVATVKSGAGVTATRNG